MRIRLNGHIICRQSPVPSKEQDMCPSHAGCVASKACEQGLLLHATIIKQTTGAKPRPTSSPGYPLVHPSLSAQPLLAHPVPAITMLGLMVLESLHHPGQILCKMRCLAGPPNLKERAGPLVTCEIERAVRVKLSARCTSAAVKNLVTWTTTPAGRPHSFMPAPQAACCMSEKLAHTAEVSLQRHGSPTEGI